MQVFFAKKSAKIRELTQILYFFEKKPVKIPILGKNNHGGHGVTRSFI